jgi:hypothetical protein
MLYRQWFRQLRVEGRSGNCTCSLNKPREAVAQSPSVMFHGGCVRSGISVVCAASDVHVVGDLQPTIQ